LHSYYQKLFCFVMTTLPSVAHELQQFILRTTWDALPDGVRRQAKLCLLDTLGTALAARGTDLSRIAHDYAAQFMQSGSAALWQDGQTASAPGAALANSLTIDALDIHEGHSFTKGHAGVAVVPAVLASASLRTEPLDGKECLTALAIGYEVSLRDGICLHATARDYHSSGAWNALGCAAVTSRRLQLSGDQTLEALGIAEFYGPRSQIMRCVDQPTMVKDGSGWGAMAGVTAALLARGGFTGRPAMTIEPDEVHSYWQDLGERWEMLRQYFKPHAVCRWAQPAVEAVIQLKQKHSIAPDRIRYIRVVTFHEATRLSTVQSQSTEEAQYSLPYSVAAAVLHGQLGREQVVGDALRDPRLLALLECIQIEESEAYSRQFPARRFADVRIEMVDGQSFEIRSVEPRWDADSPPTDEELIEKFKSQTSFMVAGAQEALLETVLRLDQHSDCATLIQQLVDAPIP
jgi:2-methylcitrate dehydratase PrpD